MRRRPWHYWLGVALIALFALCLVAAVAVGVWRFAAVGPRNMVPHGRTVHGIYDRGWTGPGMMLFGLMGPLWNLLILGLIAWGIYALVTGNRVTRGYSWPTCPNCHRQAQIDWRVCPYCGHQLGQPLVPPPPTRPGQPEPNNG